MGRSLVGICRLVFVLALMLSFVVARPGSAEGLNTLTFQFNICPAGSDTCQPYGNTDARIMNLGTGVEQWTVNDAQGWATFAGLPDGDYVFSTPAVTQQDISITCGDNATGLVIGSQVAGNGPQVALAGGQSVTCSGIMVPAVTEAPVDVVEDAVPSFSYVSSYVSECPAGSSSTVNPAECTVPGDALTASLTSGGVPNLTVVQQPLNQAGFASFSVTPGSQFQLWPGVDTSVETVLSVTCYSYTELDANGVPIGTEFVPGLGSAGYTFDVAAGESIECYFLYAEQGAIGQDPDENVGFISSYVSECPAGSTDMVDLNDCTTPSRPFTAYLASGAVPNMTTVEQPANQAGAAFFNVTPGLDFQLWPGVDVATETILHVSCISYLGEVDANGSPIGTDFVPSLGGAGYGLEVADGEAIDCFFYYAQDVTGGVDPSTSPAASGSAATSPAASGSAAGSPAASHAPSASGKPAASTAAAPVSLPNTGTGATERSSFDALLVTLAVASALLLLVTVALRRTSSR